MSQQSEDREKLDLNKTPTIDFLSKIPTTDVDVNVKEIPPKVNELDAKSRIGYHLARIVLAIICIFLIFLILYILLSLPTHSAKIDYQSLTKLPDSILNRRLSLIKSIQAEDKESRDFVIQISQMVLLNLLLPILTAILGYIFGSHSEAKD